MKTGRHIDGKQDAAQDVPSFVARNCHGMHAHDYIVNAS
jgi:hypothetical protein